MGALVILEAVLVAVEVAMLMISFSPLTAACLVFVSLMFAFTWTTWRRTI